MTPAAPATPSTAGAPPLRGERALIAALAAGSLLSVAGDQTAAIGLALRATDERFGALVSALFVAQLLPGVAFGPTGGRFVDRHELRRVQVGALLAQGCSIAAAAVAPGLWAKASLVAVSCCFGVLSGAASFRTRRHLFGDRTRRVNGALGAAASAGSVGGMALAGIGLAVAGLGALLLADALSFVVLAVVVAVVTASHRQALAAPSVLERPERHGNRLPEVALLWSPAVLGPVGFALVAVVVVSTSFEAVVCLFYLHGVVRLSPSSIGVVLATWPLGMAAAATVMAHRSSKTSTRTLDVSATGMGAAITATSRLVAPVPISAAYVVGGASNGAFSVALANVVHEGVPQEQLGAAWAVLGSVLNAGLLVGFVAGGFGSSHARVVMTTAGAVCTVAGLVVLASRFTGWARSTQNLPAS